MSEWRDIQCLPTFSRPITQEPCCAETIHIWGYVIVQYSQLSSGKDNLDMVVSYTIDRVSMLKKTSHHKLLYEEKHYVGIPLVLDPLFDSGGRPVSCWVQW